MRALLDPEATRPLVWPGLNASRTEKQKPAPYWRGRGAGGSSAINGQIAIRPPVEDFEDWARAGCTGWAREDVLPYFAKLEDDEEFGDAPYHGRGGPIPIYRTPEAEWGAVDAALARAARAAGYGWAADVNAPGATGISPYPINSRLGRRVSTNDAYLDPARDLPNLVVRGDAVVDRVLVSGGRATGVRVLVDGAMTDEHADLVVLSAGASHTPSILLRSGIGPAGQLRSLGIDVLRDLPVGQGLQDHPVVFVGIPLNEESAMRTPDDRHTNVCIRYTSDARRAGRLDAAAHRLQPVERPYRQGRRGAPHRLGVAYAGRGVHRPVRPGVPADRRRAHVRQRGSVGRRHARVDRRVGGGGRRLRPR